MVHVQCVSNDDHDGSHKTGNVDSKGYVLSIVESFDLYLSDCESENQDNDLW